MLSACGSNPASYLPTGTTPIVNIEADIADKLDVNAQSEQLRVINLSQESVNLVYKLFWYDINGVTQPSEEGWQKLILVPQQIQQITLNRPTLESVNYRIYLRHQRIDLLSKEKATQ